MSVDENEKQVPKMCSVEWEEYVMSLFTKKEMTDGKPRAEALLRVARYISNDIGIYPDFTVHSTTPEFASVTCAIMSGYNSITLSTSSAECSSHNTDEPYSKFPVETAETRAMGRALKRLLGLNILTAEEGSVKANLTQIINDESRTDGGIQEDTQIRMIDRMCKKINANVKKCINNLLGKEYNSIQELSHEEGVLVLGTLNEWEKEFVVWASDTDTPGPVPQYVQFGDYDTNWKSYFYNKG